ncbi:hypothetical protein Vadar_018205 [Vaccinium darrowii]|uniref:Uncharacterized protein n=1 Tax=Vaccinium darrowii TaxID=229202 RepID=A0ACB7YED1_9ERIC|nr:hypothetical protein Vadar_018205 [Vaccinium darrowii]
MSRVEYYGSQNEIKGYQKLFTLFVANIPEMTDRTCLTKVFNKYGVIKEVLILVKRSKNGSRFAFVKYEDPISSEMAIFRANGMFYGKSKTFD